MTPPTLQTIAREKNWMQFAVQLDAAMAQPEAYGLPDAAAVRTAVGRLRRQLPSSLTIALKAMRYLRARHPDALASRNCRIGCAPVRLLARIAELSPNAAAALAPRVFAGTVRLADLRTHYDALRRAGRQGASLASAA